MNMQEATDSKKIKIIIAEDHKIMIDGLKSLLKDHNDIDVVGVASNGREAIALLVAYEVDVAVVDISMPEMDGVELTKYIKERHPSVKVLVLSMHKQERHISRIAAAGIDGYILKDNGQREFVDSLRKLVETGYYYDQEVAHIIIKRLHEVHHPEHMQTAVKLTRREQQVLTLIGQGLQSKEVAEKLFIAKSTVESHKGALKEKLGLRDVKALIRYAIENGYDQDQT